MSSVNISIKVLRHMCNICIPIIAILSICHVNADSLGLLELCAQFQPQGYNTPYHAQLQH